MRSRKQVWLSLKHLWDSPVELSGARKNRVVISSEVATRLRERLGFLFRKV